MGDSNPFFRCRPRARRLRVLAPHDCDPRVSRRSPSTFFLFLVAILPVLTILVTVLRFKSECESVSAGIFIKHCFLLSACCCFFSLSSFLFRARPDDTRARIRRARARFPVKFNRIYFPRSIHLEDPRRVTVTSWRSVKNKLSG